MFFTIVGFVLGQTWTALTSWTIPGLSVSFGMFFLGMFIISIVIALLQKIIRNGLNMSAQEFKQGVRTHRKWKISQERKDDEK